MKLSTKSAAALTTGLGVSLLTACTFLPELNMLPALALTLASAAYYFVASYWDTKDIQTRNQALREELKKEVVDLAKTIGTDLKRIDAQVTDMKAKDRFNSRVG